VEKSIAEGRLKILPLNGDFFVGAEAILRADAPEHPMAPKFISLVKEKLGNNHTKPFVRTAAVRRN